MPDQQLKNLLSNCGHGVNTEFWWCMKLYTFIAGTFLIVGL
jgi:hypothetical protein